MPRAGLSPDVVVAEAARVADEVGYDHLTLSAVADRFGVAVPSLYKHVHGLPALRRELAVLATQELGAALAGAIEAGGDPIEGLSHAYRGYARVHPGRYAATLRAPDPSDERASEAAATVLDTVLQVLEGYGLTGSDAIDATRTLRSALHGFVTLESIGGFGLPEDVERSFSRLIEMMDEALRTWTPRPSKAHRPRT